MTQTNSTGCSAEKNIRILISLLKANGIRKGICSPGATNFTFVRSLQSDPFFELYSCVDERSAAYMACGLAAESGEPVFLSCTGATASRDYLPGLTEAYYRKLPVLAVTSHQGADRIGQLLAQNIDRRNPPKDAALLSVEIPIVNTAREEKFAVRETNRALLELRRNGGGPVHINLVTTYSPDFSASVPEVRAVRRFFAWDSLPEIPKGKAAVFVGSHVKFSAELEKAVDDFCGAYDALVICDCTSGYYGKYKILPTLAELQPAASPIPSLDLMIHIGENCAATFAGRFRPQKIWRVSEDGEIRDPFGKLSAVFQMQELFFFSHYARGKDCTRHEFFDACKKKYASVYEKIPELPFSNIWMAKTLSARLPSGSLIHIGVSNTRRSWNMFPLPDGVESSCNVGCCGIDGCTSTLIGASLANKKRVCFLVSGDLSFFYDLNSLGNRHIGNNVRILLINNGIGAEFKLYSHPCYPYKDEADKYAAAGGHFGNKSPDLVRHFAEDLGFRYLCAGTKEEFLAALETFASPEESDRSMILEAFVRHEDENTALKKMTSIVRDAAGSAKSAARKILGDKGIKAVKEMLGRE